MVTLVQSKWTLRAITLLVWAMAAGCAFYWGLRFSSGQQSRLVVEEAAPARPVDPATVARMLGATGPQIVPQASLASRFSLLGVVAGTPGGGAALISVDGKPAAPVRVGSAVDEGIVLKSATDRRVELAESADGPTLVTLDMPALNR